MSDIITITGNIATEPTRSALPNGVPVTRFRLASAQRRYDREAGAWVDGSTNWYSVSAYRALADNAGASLNKGERVVVTGRLRLRAWESDGRKGMEAEIDADALGHDLRFGTTSFRRSGQRATVGETAADGWAVPGEQPGDDEPAPEPSERTEQAETPF
ncbi:single-stranded DNA-binding protein [Microbacterium marinilacus]|uniref:Single-stranded DNA-binding protein n=1 Tax=Microbacterium marinilacus TaxID=415209 RepID=A0ABP7B2L4_9MICO|nr:single-stranded DNA-binding protein [Microbacterium marinilacus]MBY0688016.1 single-stranded DNA-binding protein [Microbacterium marinilacus]